MACLWHTGARAFADIGFAKAENNQIIREENPENLQKPAKKFVRPGKNPRQRIEKRYVLWQDSGSFAFQQERRWRLTP
jgi:hypothetical protein